MSYNSQIQFLDFPCWITVLILPFPNIFCLYLKIYPISSLIIINIYFLCFKISFKSGWKTILTCFVQMQYKNVYVRLNRIKGNWGNLTYFDYLIFCHFLSFILWSKYFVYRNNQENIMFILNWFIKIIATIISFQLFSTLTISEIEGSDTSRKICVRCPIKILAGKLGRKNLRSRLIYIAPINMIIFPWRVAYTHSTIYMHIYEDKSLA